MWIETTIITYMILVATVVTSNVLPAYITSYKAVSSIYCKMYHISNLLHFCTATIVNMTLLECLVVTAECIILITFLHCYYS